MDRLAVIREQEKRYHDYCYENYTLFAEGSWLNKPVITVLDLLPLIKDKKNIQVLDLGCGVGRNSIPIAEAIKGNNGKVVCVDLLDSALEKLKQYREEYQVREIIHLIKADIGSFEIQRDTYDFILAVSALEHVESVEVLEMVIKQMADGTKSGGVNCLVVNTDVEEINSETNGKADAQMEVNLSTNEMLELLSKNYYRWELLKSEVKPLQYLIHRGKHNILLKTNAITYVVQKKK
ncbi:class I SAM-dependent methyltransferase [Caldibacillus lycopersici]|uniref:Class I SAM-dependent methyltransferase n=1 Tax=Perspicuibacillus lycopersici TaxID=1325689 RepID=A0AAE3ITZ2_9BACI|nr:class I SAM-dependent methyltransferase [Perspicuibacillus lycopersici]MCU9614585.1 class I SAM-dependent methyltransferase [Perspicuibacillus lycopersici]